MRSTALLAIFLPITACAQGNARARSAPFPDQGTSRTPEQVIAPGVPVLPGVPHAVKVGLTVYISGMVPLDSAGRVVGPDFAAQSRQVVSNLAQVMRAARGAPGDVVHVTAYIRDITPARVDTLRTILLDSLDRDSPPAFTVVGVAALAEPGIDLVLEATGELRSEFPDRTRLH